MAEEGKEKLKEAETGGLSAGRAFHFPKPNCPVNKMGFGIY